MATVTIANFMNGKVSRQAVADFCERKILAQGGPSYRIVDGERVCAYRGKDDRMCAIGHMIPNSRYDAKTMDDNDFGVNVDYFFDTKELCDKVGITYVPRVQREEDYVQKRDFLGFLQLVHDDLTEVNDEEFLKEFSVAMGIFRTKYKLKPFKA